MGALLLFFQQLRILLWKNFLVAKRSWKLSVLRLLLPSLFVIAFFLIYHYTTKVSPPHDTLVSSSIPLCKPVVSKTCVTLAYYPDTQDVRDILELVGQYNDPPLSIGHEIMPITEYSDMQSFRYRLIYDNPNTTQAGVFFDLTADSLFKYSIVYNNTDNPSTNFLDFSYNTPPLLDIRIQLKLAIDRAYTRSLSKQPYDIELSTFYWPSSWALTSTELEALVGQVGLAFFYLGLSTTLILGLNSIVTEKERNIRGYLRSFGMMDGPYWVSWFIEMITFQILSILLLMAFGYIFPGLNFFHKSNFFSIFFIFLVYGIELICLCFFLSSLVSKTRAANILGFLIYFFGLGIAIAFSFIGNIVWFLYDEKVIKVAGNWMGGLSFFPPMLFSVIVVDVQARTVAFNQDGGPGSDSSSSSSSDSGSDSTKIPGFKWGDMQKHPGGYDYVPSVSWTLGIMMLYSVAFALLAWYLDNIISDSFGARRHPLFPFQPSYWGFNKKLPYSHDITPHVQQSIINRSGDDLAAEQDHHDLRDKNVALRIVNVSKTFGLFTHVQAVKMMNLKCTTGTVLALLGHNGAGKTSLINILTGLSSATQGDAFIYGFSVTHDMDEIRSIMGVCPQFDVFWPDLTAREHLEIALGMKTSGTNLQHEIDEKLNGVRLRKVANHQVQTFSGGMRRRLSVALSMVGNPKVIMLDEPTTGIDPANRRYIWKLIHSIKQDKLVILTTHSMEEADRLGEKIAIMNHGVLSAVGSPLHLKSKYSSGYRINFVVGVDQVPQLKHFVATTLPVAILTAENAGSLIYVVPDGTDAEIVSNFFSTLQSGKIARDWGVSNTTLEDVFLRVTAKQV